MDNRLTYLSLGFDTEANRHQLGGSRWWRASRYEIVGGTHIAPASDAEIEVYDLFDEQRMHWGGRRKMGVEAPYESLIRLDLSHPGSICSWCEQFGLLGIAHQRLESAYLWPTWTSFDRSPPFFPTVKPRQVRLSQGLQVRAVLAEMAHPPSITGSEGLEDCVGELLTVEELEAALEQSVRQQGVLRRPNSRLTGINGTVREASVTEGVIQFLPRIAGVCDWTAWHAEQKFPHLHEVPSKLGRTEAEALGERLSRTTVPHPLSDAFLRGYGEPLHLVYKWVYLFRKMLEFWVELDSAKNADDLEAAFRSSDLEKAGSLPSSFDVILRSVSPLTRFNSEADDGPWEQIWTVPSLVGALSVMILQEHQLGKAVFRRCKECNRVFSTDKVNRLYCSKTCRGNWHQREYRKRLKEESDE